MTDDWHCAGSEEARLECPDALDGVDVDNTGEQPDDDGHVDARAARPPSRLASLRPSIRRSLNSSPGTGQLARDSRSPSTLRTERGT